MRKLEAGVMQRTAHRVPLDEPVGERTAVVGAGRTDRENVSVAAHEQNRVLSDMAGELAAVWQFGESNSLRQIGADGLSLVFSHFVLPAILRARASRRGDSTIPNVLTNSDVRRLDPIP